MSFALHCYEFHGAGVCEGCKERRGKSLRRGGGDRRSEADPQITQITRIREKGTEENEAGLIRPVGTYGDIGIFSFCQDKIMTTGGEGGMLLTDDDDLWAFCWFYKDHGKSHDAVYNREHPPGFRWLHESFGTNWRMTEMQAAIGRVQLRKLPQWLTLRRKNAAVLTDGFSRIPGLRLTIPPPEIEHAYYKYYVFVEPEALKSDWSRNRIMTALMAEGIPCGSGSCSEIYLEKAFDQGALRPRERLPVARQLGETSLMFMVHPTLSADDMNDAVRAMDKVMRAAVR